MMTFENIYPERVFYYFGELAKIPHGSRNTKEISDYLVQFANDHELFSIQDEMNNVIIIKEASSGYENAAPVIIQGHMDMVCEKENGCTIDFTKDGLDLYIDGDFLKARGTTLGGDDGIAVAYALALLEASDIPHPRLEVIVTVDEEIGMLGAAEIDLSMLKGRMMLNIDSDEEGIFICGCAGGMSVHTCIPVTRTRQSGTKFTITVNGLSGGHSGVEIDKEHGNADIIMGRVLKCIFNETPFGILSLEGGMKDNAIPRECTAEILLSDDKTEAVNEIVKQMDTILKKELVSSDSGVTVSCTPDGSTEGDALDFSSVNRVIYYLRTVPNGILHMSQQMNGQVETSLNLGIMKLTEDALTTVTSVRSSVSTRKAEVYDKVAAIVEMLGGTAEATGDYPAWEYKQDSALRPAVEKVYEKLFHKKPVFETIHAGLECGLISEKIEDLDCVSFGPANYDIHTPKERLSISSTGRIWDFLTEFLREMK